MQLRDTSVAASGAPGADPAVTVIIPTRDRRETVGATLDALGAQRLPLDRMEVLVVADGCIDGTAAMVRGYRAPYALRLVELPPSGAAAARNAGAAAARAPLLLFLDDDVTPEPALVAAHARAHERGPGRVVMGYSRPATQGPASYADAAWRDRREARFRELGAPGHRFGYRDLLGGNMSVAATLFAAAGGFDESVGCRADYELGARLIDAGVTFAFEPEAAGQHRGVGAPGRSAQRARVEGRGDVDIGTRHPALRLGLPLADFEARVATLERALRALAFHAPRLGDLAAGGLARLGERAERASTHRHWERLDGLVPGYWYWRGVAERIGGRPGLAAFLHAGGAALAGEWGGRALDVELQEGLPAAERAIDAARPMGVRLRHAAMAVGEISAVPGAERLRGAHLQPALAGSPLAWPLLMARAFADAMGPDRPPLAATTSAIGRPPSFAAD